jgi:hypothetical protein
MKNNIDYYQHYANADQHPKFKMLRVKHGWAGEGRFWALNNRIAQADNCCLDISKKYNAASIASDLGLTIDEFRSFIDYLQSDCELIRECEPGVITTDIIQENFKGVSANREKARDRKQRYLEKVSKSSPELSKSSAEQNKKVKESKVKERKVNITTTSPEPLHDSRPEPAEVVESVLEISLIPMDGMYPVTQSQIDFWQTDFPGIDVLQTLRTIRQWNLANPSRRKTRRGIEKHIVGWLAKEQNRAGSSRPKNHRTTRSEQNMQACQNFINGATDD